MINILLFIHIVIAALLIIVILMQKTGNDGLSSIGGNNMGVMAGRTVVNFLTKTTVVLAILFIINAIILANLSSRKNPSIIEQIDTKLENTSLPIAK
ncbi:preprotein translocase subunit SecG [Candidatus Tisiphia endosymbiont of Nemotelus uliginosus]|uniref:preprotein translocase subunit SecG n=1 Tax=Candidatus Tisiphia endosymbiont of Nemotelus uliginosus TaxID=3077926 RepID=UPI0035C91C5B